MTDHQINAAIALACKWQPNCDNGICWDSAGRTVLIPPNYCGDLNAMHEAELSITNALKWNKTYSNMLARVTESHYSDDPSFFCATARQRAEAFLKTIGKWEESK